MEGRSFGDGGASSWVRIQTAAETANPLAERVCVPMELAGLEPATSWVRSKSAAAPNPHHERVSGHSSGAEPLGYPALTRGFWGWNALHPQNGGLVLSE
jgi:hypothetical protein